jgi:hypothetical protein
MLSSRPALCGNIGGAHASTSAPRLPAVELIHPAMHHRCSCPCSLSPCSLSPSVSSRGAGVVAHAGGQSRGGRGGRREDQKRSQGSSSGRPSRGFGAPAPSPKSALKFEEDAQDGDEDSYVARQEYQVYSDADFKPKRFIGPVEAVQLEGESARRRLRRLSRRHLPHAPSMQICMRPITHACGHSAGLHLSTLRVRPLQCPQINPLPNRYGGLRGSTALPVTEGSEHS